MAEHLVGLKAQHASSLRWLAEATQAEVTGCFVGSKEFEFAPSVGPTALLNRNIKIASDSAGSVLLVFQALFPYLLFAGDDTNSPITLTIDGGTNVSFSLSYDYLDQVLLPTLELLGLPKVERKIDYSRGWSHGTKQIGRVQFKFTPLKPGQQIDASSWPELRNPGAIKAIDVTIVVPTDLRTALQNSLRFELDLVFPGVGINFVVDEDSRHQARMYTLLVAHTASGLRFGRDWLYDKSAKNKSKDVIATEIAQKVVDELDIDFRNGGGVDEYLQDQLVVFQALAAGRSVVSESSEDLDPSPKEMIPTCGVNEAGDMHAKTARWVASQLLPGLKWMDKGRVCDGVGLKMQPPYCLEEKFSSLQITGS